MAARSDAAMKSEEVVFTRVFDAPREVVFRAWTDPKQVAQWWGPQGFTNPVCELDVRRGGAIRIDMRGPDGTVYPMAGVYEEIVAPERIVFSSGAIDENGKPLFEVLNIVTLAERGGKTTLTLHVHVVKSTAAAARHLAGMEVGWTQSLERLETFVDKAQEHSLSENTVARELSITRMFDAPRDLVFEAWTNSKHVAQWWGPRGFTTTIQEMDVRPGGVWKLVMHGPDGTDYPNQSVFTEVVKPERLAYSLSGGKKGTPSVGFDATVTFDAVGGKTRLTMRMVFPSAAERDRVVKEYGADEGLVQTMDRLTEQLAKISCANQGEES